MGYKMKINKTDLCRLVSERTGISQQQTRLTVNTMLECIERVLVLGGCVSIRDFGTFSLKKMAARKIWNPLTEEKINVPARLGIQFKPGLPLKRALNLLKEKYNEF